MKPSVVLGLLALFLTIWPGLARSEDGVPKTDFRSRDDRLLDVLNDKKRGAVVIDAELIINKNACSSVSVTLANAKSAARPILLIVATGLLGKRLSYTGLATLVPGDYFVSSVTCGVLNQSQTVLRGPHAAFRVRPGELAQLGLLRVEAEIEGFLTKTGKIRRTVHPPRPERLAELKAKFPTGLARAVQRPMVVIGGTEVSIKPKTLF